MTALFTLMLLVIAVFLTVIIMLTVKIFADKDILFTKVPEGEIIVVMYSEKKAWFIGNISGFWVDKETGQVWEDIKKENFKEEDLKNFKKPHPAGLPFPVFGIYWLGWWPFASVYKYKFEWNKYAKGGSRDYQIVPKKDELTRSIYFTASYPIQITGAETGGDDGDGSPERIPLTLDFLVKVQTTNADIALFKVKSPGWLAALNGAVESVARDFVGDKLYDQIIKLQVEAPVSGTKSEIQTRMESLNSSSVGNPSIQETLGQKIVAVNFLGVTMEEAKTEQQKVSIAKYKAKREGEAKIAAIPGKKADIDIENYKIESEGISKGKGLAGEATGLKALADAVKDNPEIVGVRLAEAIQTQKTATTLILGQGVMPTKQV